MDNQRSTKPSIKGHLAHASSAEDSPINVGSAPRVGQGGKAYVSGSNAHNRHQSRQQGPAPGNPEMPYGERDSGAGGGKAGPKSRR